MPNTCQDNPDDDALFDIVLDGLLPAANVCFGAALVYLGLRVCLRANSGKGTLLVAAAKHTMLILVYVAIGAILASGSRRKHERETTAVKRNAAAVTATAAGYAAWSVWVSRVGRFTPVSNWISGPSHTLHADDSAVPDGHSIV